MKKKDNMYDNFRLLEERVMNSLEVSDLEQIREMLSSIKGHTVCTGVGGSSVVSEFASKVLSEKNGGISCDLEPRDMLYKNLDGFSNVVACSYSGNNLGVDISFRNDLNKYLLSSREIEGINNILYRSDIYKEDSFISLGATLIPMSILLNYYLDGDTSIIEEVLKSKNDFLVEDLYLCEVLGGCEVSTALKFLESTMVETGIAVPIIHDKYSYCHGRSTTSYHNDSSLVYFRGETELDQVYEEVLGEYYNNFIKIDNKYDDLIINDFYMTYQMMLLCRVIAEYKNKDLSRVEYSPVVKKLYRYSGRM